MEVKSMEYFRRKNIGNYEHEELKVSAVMEEGEGGKQAFAKLKDFVLDCLDIKQKDESQLVLPVMTKEPKKEAVKEAVKSEKASEEKKPSDSKVDNKVKEEEKKAKGRPKSEVIKAPAVETKPVKKAVKYTNYDRSIDTHKNLLGQFLDKSYPTWRVAENLKKASEASKALNGASFLDSEGEILDSFKESFSKLME